MHNTDVSTRKALRSVVGQLAPPGTRRRAALTRLVDPRAAGDAAAYQDWIAHAEQHSAASLVDPSTGPLISLIVPAFNTPDRYLIPMVDSVIGQSYAKWELLLVDASTAPDRSAAILGQSARDERIRMLRLTENQGIAGNTNAGIDAAAGAYVAFLDHDDTLAPFALNEVAAALERSPNIDVFYSDEDKLNEQGDSRSDPFFKPGWSPDLFLSVNYLAHFVVARTTLVRSIGGIRRGYEGAQDYDFLLRVLEHGPNIHHVARISYHWRKAEGSTARDPGKKAYAEDSGCRALRDHVARSGIHAAVELISPQSTTYRLRYDLPHRPDVHVGGTVALPLHVGLLQEGTDGLRLSELPAGDALLSLPASDIVLILEVPGRPDGRNWLTELAAVALQPGIGVVAPALRSPGGAGAGVGYAVAQGRLWPLFAGESPDRWTPAGWPDWPRNVAAVGGCGVLTVGLARELLAGGAQLGVVSLSLAAHRLGLRNLHWPFAGIVTPSVLQPLTMEEPIDDPYLNPNLAFVLPGLEHLATEPGSA